MNVLIITIVSLGVGFLLGIYSYKNNIVGSSKKDLIGKQREEKKRNKEAIIGLMESGNQPLTNNRVEQMLGISDATAERYLHELEDEGIIRQVGKTGRDVFYEKI
jgi:Fic family protein